MAYDTSAVLSESELAVRRRAVRFFWVVLIASSGASIVGNALHAVVHASSVSPVLAAAVATAPPLVLLGSTEGLSLLVKVRRRPTLTYWAALAMALLLALAAFRLSFDALRDLAVLCGLRPSLAWLWPLVVDVTITQATVSLLALSRQAQRGFATGHAIEETSEFDGDSASTTLTAARASVVAMVPAQRQLATGRKHAAGKAITTTTALCTRSSPRSGQNSHQKSSGRFWSATPTVKKTNDIATGRSCTTAPSAASSPLR